MQKAHSAAQQKLTKERLSTNCTRLFRHRQETCSQSPSQQLSPLLRVLWVATLRGGPATSLHVLWVEACLWGHWAWPLHAHAWPHAGCHTRPCIHAVASCCCIRACCSAAIAITAWLGCPYSTTYADRHRHISEQAS